MKRRFCFENLISEKRAFPLLEKEALFFSMRGVMQSAVHCVWVDSLSELEHLMVNDEYYIALNIVTSKGRQQFFREDFVSCTKIHLLDFLNKEVDWLAGYSRPFIIAPLFAVEPHDVISISEDACIRYFTVGTKA